MLSVKKKELIMASKVFCFGVLFCFVLISVLEVIHELRGNGTKPASWRTSIFKKQEEKKTARKEFREQKSQVAEELALHMASVKQRVTGTRLDQVPKQRCY